MLKHKSGIVSRLFDTINKIDAGICGTSIRETNTNEEKYDDELIDDNAYNINNNYVVSVPNHKPSIHNNKSSLICIYQVRTDGLYPFLLFLLHNRKEANFIEIPAVSGYQKIKYASIAYAKTILPNTSIAYAGFYELPDKNIIILNGSEQHIEIYTSNEYIWTTSFEIINKKKIGNTPIQANVLDFFNNNLSFLTLKTTDQRIYETPMIGYFKPRNDVECDIEELDIYRETLLPNLGKCYYLFIDIPPFREKYIMRIVFFAGEMALYGDNKKTYDSMLCNTHRRYMIQNYNQHLVLSVLSRPDKILIPDKML